MRAFSVIDVQQRTPEWVQAKLGRLTGSLAPKAFTKVTKGWAASRRQMVMRLALERLTRRPVGQNAYQSAAMKDGIEREPEAIKAFEMLTGDMVERTGFLSHNALMVGASLDGHMGDFETLLSVKCRQPDAHWEFYRTKEVPDDAKIQMRHELWLTGADLHIYFEFNPDFPEKARCQMVPFTRKQLDVDAYGDLVNAFLSEVQAEYEAIRTMTDLPAVLAEAVS